MLFYGWRLSITCIFFVLFRDKLEVGSRLLCGDTIVYHEILILYLALVFCYHLEQLLGAHSNDILVLLTLKLNLGPAPLLKCDAHSVLSPHFTLVLFNVARLQQEVVAGACIGTFASIATLSLICGVKILEPREIIRHGLPELFDLLLPIELVLARHDVRQSHLLLIEVVFGSAVCGTCLGPFADGFGVTFLSLFQINQLELYLFLFGRLLFVSRPVCRHGVHVALAAWLIF